MRKVTVFILIFLTVLSICFIIYFYLRISHILVKGADSLEGVSSYYHRLLFAVKPEKLEQKIYDKNPTVDFVHVSREFPNTLNITVTKALPIAKLKIEDGYMGISLKGRIILKQREDISATPLEIDYFEPLYYRNFAVGDFIDIKEVADAVLFINEVNKLAIPISKVDIQNENMIVLKSEEGDIRVSSTKNVNEQIAQLKTVMDHIRIQSLTFSRIDVRFEKPIVAFK